MDAKASPNLLGLPVIAAHVGTNAVLHTDQHGVKRLIVSPHQSFSSAVASISAVMPEASRDDVLNLVRRHLVTVRNDGLLDLPPAALKDSRADRRACRRRSRVALATLAVVALLAGAVVAGIAIGRQQTSVRPIVADTGKVGVFDDYPFPALERAGLLRCTTHSDLSARCTMGDSAFFAQAWLGESGDWVQLEADDQRFGLVVFRSLDEASWWTSEHVNQVMYDNVRLVGRVVLYGMPEQRVSQLQQALVQSQQLDHTPR